MFPRSLLSDVWSGLIQVLWTEGHIHSWCFSVLNDHQNHPVIFEKMHCWASIRFDETESQGENEESLLLLLDFDNQPDLETTERETQSSFSRKETSYLSFLSSDGSGAT